jgi:hypothetical protein
MWVDESALHDVRNMSALGDVKQSHPPNLVQQRRQSTRPRLRLALSTVPPSNPPGNGAGRKEWMARFGLGQLLATPGVLAAAGDEDLMPYLARHAAGDWGVVGREDARANDRALREGTRLLSAYVLADGTTRIWIITEADHSATTILLPDEY